MHHAVPLLAPARRFGVILGLLLAFWMRAAEPESGPVEGKWVDPEMAIKQFKIPSGFKADLFTAEPQLANPVSLAFDERGRVFLAETFRLVTSVYDIRSHMNMYLDDLACRTVEDRAAMIQKYLGPKTGEMAVESEVIRLLEDRAGTGRADRSTVFADGFNTILDGVGAGVLARKGKLYYANIPNLWILQDSRGSGRADQRASLSYGYGVHFGFTGHDLHGLRVGPDGKLYFSIGDRGLHVRTREGKMLDYPDTGCVLRCDLDGSGLEVFAYGLRNPQDLAFDDHGNLLTGDNNCDHGDAARLVYVVENGDSGWRIANQFSDTTPAGVWNSEKVWHLQFPEQAAYIVPPIAHIADGPSGLAHYPGTGFPESYLDHFFLCDFRGSPANSGIHSFALKPQGAGFEMVDHTKFFWGILATDAQFSPDGRLYVTDWVQGWDPRGQGRIYRLYDPGLVKQSVVWETKEMIAEGMEKRSPKELQALLDHPDQRIRLEAQFELAARALTIRVAPELGQKYIDILAAVATGARDQLPRLHAIWGLGQVGRSFRDSLEPLLSLLADRDAEVRAQTAKVLGDDHFTNAFAGLTKSLGDPELRVRFFAAQSLGKLGNKGAVAPLLAMLRENADKDVFLRHAGVMGLVGTADQSALIEAGKNGSRSVRMAALLAMRRRESADVAMFLHDADPLIVLEAARAINDLPIPQALPQLASLVDLPTESAPLGWRAVNANFRLGEAKNATALAACAARNEGSERAREEALYGLETWSHPSPRDRITGLWRPLAGRNGKAAADALRPVVGSILGGAPNEIRVAAIRAAEGLSLADASPAIFTLAMDARVSAEVRIEALKALNALHDSHLPEAVKMAGADSDENVRKEGNRLQAEIKPGEALDSVGAVLRNGTIKEQQGALETLGGLAGEGADQLLADWLDKLMAGTVPREIQLDLIEAAGKRASALVKDKLQQYLAGRPKDDEFAGFREALYGGDAEAGRKIFLERPDASCVRCHKIKGEGGAVGPELTGIINRHDREFLLESILFPNKQIAPGFESALVEMNGGQSYAGIVKSQDDTDLNLLSIEDGALLKLKKSDIKKQIKGLSPMPEGMGNILSKSDLRNLVEFLATLK